MSEQTVVDPRPDLLEEGVGNAGDWFVIVFNNEVNTFDQVIGILQKATGCSLEEAEMETWEVHNLGQSRVHYASRPECDRVAAIISTIGIKVAVDSL
ncbi:MAG TPA: ATP-dependent Clp protease adaptor ClpS [Armatimonadota bacterium]|jgi:ATP-dependent Clp protease adapter protein ClpS|nr:ATP-dependent Clp protease adaptor ClpS [Armatimonadota bacterium]